MTDPRLPRLVSLLTDPVDFARSAGERELRPYQAAPISRLLASIRNHHGDTIIIVFPRQSGKDELLLQLQAYLLYLYASVPVGIVIVNPTYHPQTVKAIRRFDALLDRNLLTRRRWRKHGRFNRALGQARVSFLSGDSKSNVVGDTASLLLVVNEAQDILPGHYYRKFVPMTASTNATRLLAGTVWTRDTLLSREIRLAHQAEQRDGRQRVFMVDADGVAAHVQDYGRHVQLAIHSHGRQHPFVKTQYFNEELDAQSGLFTPARLALIRPDRAPVISPPCAPVTGGTIFEENGAAAGGREENHHTCDEVAFLLDVAGQDEAAIDISSSLLLDNDLPLANAARDSVALSIVGIDLSTLELLGAPTYRVLKRHAWTGLNHLTVFGRLKALAESWNPGHFVIDATGVGEGLWAMLEREFPGRVTPVKYSAAVKSEIGYRFISIIETGRFRDHSMSPQGGAPDPHVEAQYRACQAEILPGPAKTLRWYVPDGARDSSGELLHDDYLMADSLVAVLDRMEWYISSPSVIIHRDIQAEIDRPDISDFFPGLSRSPYESY